MTYQEQLLDSLMLMTLPFLLLTLLYLNTFGCLLWYTRSLCLVLTILIFLLAINLALDSNSSGKQSLDSKSVIFFTPGTWYHNSMLASFLIFVTWLLTYYLNCYFIFWILDKAIAESVRHISYTTGKSVDNMEQTLLVNCANKRVLINFSQVIVTGLIGHSSRHFFLIGHFFQSVWYSLLI